MMSTKYFSTKQETSVAKYLEWEVVSGSGARDTLPGDVISDEWLGECKTHMVPSETITFELGHWQKIKAEALAKFKNPVLICDNGTQETRNTWCMFSADYFDLESYIVEHPSVSVRKNFKLKLKDFRRHIVYSFMYDDSQVGVAHISIFKELLGG